RSTRDWSSDVCSSDLNACEAGRVRGGLPKELPKGSPKAAHKPASAQVVESLGVAEALMRGGIANYMSTYWPVGDDAAKDFAGTRSEERRGGRECRTGM